MSNKTVCLVEMPFSSVTIPVFSLSLLKGCLNRAGIKSEVIYGNMRFFAQAGFDDYQKALYSMPQFIMFGEAVFAAAAFENPALSGAYREQLKDLTREPDMLPAEAVGLFERLESRAKAFIAELGGLILKKKPRIVAFSTLFFQTNACIALANYLKKQQPDIITLIGGANSVGRAAWALAKYNPGIDYAFSGEADEIFAAVCETLLRDGAIGPEAMPAGLVSKETAALPEEIPVRNTVALDSIAYPDYSDYFAALKECGLENFIKPALFAELSRGCWWNVASPCRFCGLNEGIHSYRTKSVPRVLAEFEYLRNTYGVSSFYLTDNVLSPLHVRELVPLLEGLPEKYTFFAEVKANLSRKELFSLRRAGFEVLQPGIESLQDDILTLMNKGCRAIKQIEFLKNAVAAGIAVVWHLLVGFPGEKEEHYEELAEILPLITHYRPPQQLASIVFVRDSEYVKNAEKYGLSLTENRFYDYVFPGEDFRRLMAVMYQPETAKKEASIHGGRWSVTPVRRRVLELVSQWQRGTRVSPERLQMTERDGVLEIMDLRRAAVQLLYTLTGAERAVALAAEEVIRQEELLEGLAGQYERDTLLQAIGWLEAHKLLLAIKGELLFLPLRADEADGRLLYVKPVGGYFDKEGVGIKKGADRLEKGN